MKQAFTTVTWASGGDGHGEPGRTTCVGVYRIHPERIQENLGKRNRRSLR